jgi:HK97 family phage major capsid protein
MPRVLSDRPTIAEVRSALEEAGYDYHQMRQRPAEQRTANHDTELRETASFIRDADLILTALERGSPILPDPGTGILPPGAQPGGGPVAALGGMGAPNPGQRSLGLLVTQDEGYRSFAQQRQSGATFHEIEIPGSLFAYNTAFRATIIGGGMTPVDGSGGGVFAPVGQPIPPPVRQMRMFLRDMINVQQTTLSSIPYIREVNPAGLEYSASAVAENTAKPEVVLDWTLDDAPVRKVAAWVPVTTEIIDDAPTLQGYIDGRLAYMLAVREEFEILNGSGSAPHLKGILQYAEIQSQTFSTDAITSIGLGIGKVENVDGEADGVAMNPLDYWEMVTTRHSTNFDGSGIAGPGLPYTNAQTLGAWGLNTVRSRALVRGAALVGSWRLGATLFDRMQTTIKVGNQHSDYFVNNKVAVLAEERVALAVHRPDFFVNVDIAA